MKYSINLGLVLFGVWLLWSGHFTAMLIGCGVGSCLLVLAVARRMQVVDDEGAPIELALRGLAYAPWLMIEIVKSNLDVARRIVDPALPISPRVIRVRLSQRSDIGRVIHANSITLTPGTVSIAMEPGQIVVHALTRELAEETLAGAIDARVTRLEGPA